MQRVAHDGRSSGPRRITVRILAPDLVEIAVRPSWWLRLLGASTETTRARLPKGHGINGCWIVDGHRCLVCYDDGNNKRIRAAIARAFAADDARRRAEVTRNYQAAAQRGEYPLR